MSANNRLLPSSQQMAPPNMSKVLDDDQDGVDDGQALSLIVLKDGKLMANGRPFLVDVPSNVVVTPAASSVVIDAATAGCFVGFDGSSPESWQTFSLGRLLGIRFMSIFRFKVWWTTQWVGSRGRDLEHETQFLLLDKSDDGSTTITTSRRRRRPYVLILPIIEGQFRASLQPGDDDNVDVCVESGSTTVKSSTFRTCVYMHATICDDGDPFTLVKDAIKVVRAHLGTFRLLEEKTSPPIVDKFGWCTWDAFYLKVHPDGVLQGVKSLADGGCLPGLVLIDDGWQTILHDEDQDEDGGMNRTSAGEQMPCRLVKFEENKKFTNKGGLPSLTKELRETYGVQHVYVWHALCGYWGGVRPKSTGGVPESEVVNPLLTPGLKMTMEDLAVDKIVRNGIGLVPPEKAGDLYRGLHSHLSDVGVDGVKVDVIHLLEMLCENYGGRVDLAKSYYKALSDSVRRHFNGNGVIASMEHCNDFMLLGTETISLGRVGDDFWCTDPSGDPNGTFWLQGCHMAHCAYNSLWMGNFIHPDWDMFQSTHPCAEFHAASRAISGGPIYISDNVGEHDFRLLKSLALPDGTILRCESYALPTRDCLFSDPLHDGKTTLKIWNLNKFNGVIGIFNCQGGGWCRQSRRNTSASEFSHRVKTTAKPQDVEWKSSSTSEEVFAVYWFKEGKMELLKGGDGVEISLDPFNFELLTVSPVKLLPLPPTKNSNNDRKDKIKFAPIGLVNMLNTGGGIQGMEFTTTSSSSTSVRLRIKGSGELKVYSSLSPCVCCVNGEEASFCYRENVVSLQVPWLSDQPSVVEYLYY